MKLARGALGLLSAAAFGACSLPDYPAWRGARDVPHAALDAPRDATNDLASDILRDLLSDASAAALDARSDALADVANEADAPQTLDVTDASSDVPQDVPRDASVDLPRDVADACATPTLEAVEQLALGRNHTCARTADRRAWCWGADADGQLGDGVRTAAGRARPGAVPCLVDVVQLALGDAHSCARVGDGTVRCWGANDAGQLGDGTMTARASPVTVLGADGRPFASVAEITAGARHTCARRNDGFVWCWGANDRGQLGDGSVTARTTPVRAGFFDDATRVTAGGAHSCALRRSEAAQCWGANDAGQVGDGTLAMSRTMPVPVNNGRSFEDIFAGGSHTCAQGVGGTVWCWGLNANFQLGDRGGPRSVPTPVAAADATQSLALGAAHTCALRGDLALRCWGANASGQVGDGTTVDRGDPAIVAALGPVSEVAAGGGHTCVRLTLGGVRCWGGNSFGQLGDGTTTSRTRPVAVLW